MSTPRNPFVGLAIAQPAPDPTVPATSEHPDAALIAACTEYHCIQRAFEAYCATLNDDLENEDEEYARTVLDPLKDLEETIVKLRATTAKGHFARARCCAFYYLPHHSGCQDDPGDAPEDRFKAAALRDLVHAERGAAAGGTVTAHPDAELVAACAAFDELKRGHNTVFKGIVEGTPEWNAAEDQDRRIQEAQQPLVARMVELRAVTLAGYAARARSLALWEGDDP